MYICSTKQLGYEKIGKSSTNVYDKRHASRRQLVAWINKNMEKLELERPLTPASCKMTVKVGQVQELRWLAGPSQS